MTPSTSSSKTSTLVSSSVSQDAQSVSEAFPEIAFAEPSHDELGKIESLLSTGHSKAADKSLESLFIHHLPQEKIRDDTRISVPDPQSRNVANGNDYASFGDEGTTVTVNAYGSIMQITRSLGYGHSGLFSVHTTDICEPTQTQSRLDQLMQMSGDPKLGIRLEHTVGFEDQADVAREKPKLEFMFNRWPRFTSQPAVRYSKGPIPTQPPSLDYSKDPCVCIQYFCHRGTVFQRYTFENHPEAPSALQNGLLRIQKNFLIRTLDFTKDSAFNSAQSYNESYIYFSGPKNSSYVSVHRLTESNAAEMGIDEQTYRDNGGPRAVALIVSAFVNGKVQTLDPFGTSLFVGLSKGIRHELENPGRVDITIAYRLQVLKNTQSWRNSIIPASSLRAMGSLFSGKSDKSFRRLRWSSNEHVDFITGRNLEHILSVCSMPVPKRSNATKLETALKHEEEAGGALAYVEDEMDKSCLAFTCGDMSGHRVANTASFFAFQFLIEISKILCEKFKETDERRSNLRISLGRMKNFTDKNRRDEFIDGIHEKVEACTELLHHISELQLRILTTLEAHLRWAAQAEKKRDTFATNYWITGREIGDQKTHRSLPLGSLTDVPFEVIKYHSLYKFYEANSAGLSLSPDHTSHLEVLWDLKNRALVGERLGIYIRPWLQGLSERDKRQNYVFPRGEKDQARYHLSDHVWICRAIRCAEELGLEEYLDFESGKQYLAYPPSDKDSSKKQPKGRGSAEPKRACRSTELQRVVLKRFTTRNPQSQQRMLATSRTSSESRFLFHAKDTALFYAMDTGFFDREEKKNHSRTNWINKIAVWKETVEAQMEHEETQTLDWEKPLWYALAFLISSRRKKINKASPDDVLHITAKILFGLASSSGLFPGFLNDNKEPVVFEDELERDKYWYTAFEIPYVLLMYGREYLEALPGRDDPNRLGALYPDTAQIKSYSQLHQPMAKKMEFGTLNGLIDKSRIVEVSDDWLREAPQSLNFDTPTSFSDRWIYQVLHNADPNLGKVISKALEDENGDSSEVQCEHTGVVFDIPKNSSSQQVDKSGMDSRRLLQTNAEIKQVLEATRTTQMAKKRLIWLPRAGKETALTCYLAASTGMEQINLSSFFDKHASYEKHFYDGTSAALNEWVTELHLSYFRRAEWNATREEQDQTRDTIPDLSFITVNARVADVGKTLENAKIVRSSMSFRFVGDFFDRYWTCHFLEFDPASKHSGPKDTLKSRLSDLAFGSNKEFDGYKKAKQPWQQRKVLELLLFDYILGEMHSSTKELLEWIRDVIIEKDNNLNVDGINTVSILEMPFNVRATEPLNPLAEALQAGVQSFVETGSDGYFSIVERWRFFEQVLQAIEEDLSRNLETISFWSSREQDREPERPRWTQNDEMSYREVITKLKVMNHKKIRDLESLSKAIKTFQASLTGKLDTMRSDLEYQGSESINLFTYVTVVFLPLGFATGIFSMSGSPDLSTLVNMIELSLVAMAITMFALSNAKTTGRTVVHPIVLTLQYINNFFLEPLLRPFCWLGNILLHLAMIVEFRLRKWFFQFMGYPVVDWLNDGVRLLIPSWNPASVRQRYRNVVHSNRQVIAKRKDRNPRKAAKEDIESRKSSRTKCDEESGKP